MREKIRINHGWRLLLDPPADPVARTKAGMYLSAKTERLKWGPGAWQHNDTPEYWSWNNELPEERWQTVDLPHDFIISQIPDEQETNALGYLKSRQAWYRKHFTLSPEDDGKRLTIYFEGITGISDVYLNGCFLKHNNGGYCSFEVDISDLARYDRENVLAVHVNPDSYETWWYEGGGIYRNVWLVKTAPVAVDLWGVFIPAAKRDDDVWDVPVQVEVRNITYDDAPVTVHCELFAPDGSPVTDFSFTGIAAAREVTTLQGAATVKAPRLWDVSSPEQYTMNVTILRDGEACDTVAQRFGFRTVQWTPDRGLLLNGRSVKIKGVCGHLDCGLTGKAVSDNLCRYKIQLVREMGANAIRTSHYPHQEAVMDACDELGLMVMDETRRFESCEDGLAQMAMLVRRDRNRPSVIVWSTSNEEVAYHSIPQGHRIHKALEHICHKLDPTRLVTAAVSDPSQTTIQSSLEVIGINYGLARVDAIHAQFPDKPIFSSENCAVGSTRGWYYGDAAERGFLDARDRQTRPQDWFCSRETTWKFIQERPWYAGGFQWDAFEHRGEAGWPRLSSVSGAIDLYLQRKDAFYQNQSHWLDTPMLHLLPHWNHRGLDGMPLKVWIYTNCEEAELFLNGVSLGRRAVEKGTHLEWTVPYTPGKLSAVGYNGGVIAAQDAHETTGAPVKLHLSLDNNPVFANGEDIAVYTCTALDSQGREVPDASPLVHFDCVAGGRIIGTGSVNTDHHPVQEPDRLMHAGRISVAVKLNALPKDADRLTVTLIARADDLDGTFLTTEHTAK